MEQNEKFQKWEHFKVVKKFTFFPLRIYQYTSQRTWWSWWRTTYILKSKCYHSEADNFFYWIISFFNGHFWENERMSDIEEYNDYIKYN